MTIRDIPRDQWRDELDIFSRQHEDWLVSITTRTPDGRVAVQARDLPLQGVNPVSPASNDIAIVVRDAQSHLTHAVHDPSAIKVDLTDDRAERALIIDASDGTTTTVEFRSPMRTDAVDGMPAAGSE
jgi:hypothetical protein